MWFIIMESYLFSLFPDPQPTSPPPTFLSYFDACRLLIIKEYLLFDLVMFRDFFLRKSFFKKKKNPAPLDTL